jgi:hypothetical protein
MKITASNYNNSDSDRNKVHLSLNENIQKIEYIFSNNIKF